MHQIPKAVLLRDQLSSHCLCFLLHHWLLQANQTILQILAYDVIHYMYFVTFPRCLYLYSYLSYFLELSFQPFFVCCAVFSGLWLTVHSTPPQHLHRLQPVACHEAGHNTVENSNEHVHLFTSENHLQSKLLKRLAK